MCNNNFSSAQSDMSEGGRNLTGVIVVMKERISSIIERLPLGGLIGERTQNTESKIEPPFIPLSSCGGGLYHFYHRWKGTEKSFERVRVTDEFLERRL
ncbi:hypothetical protein NPIL_622321 [Nephila pilipes]|uniref:Uncharacterized protein n=1 Tax=Nephila pilipes TaxID=299642 RepID=A0A8X6QJ33_NEPPI|nr:hypothetical protein NPIL_622321 [Nephila pilipes]